MVCHVVWMSPVERSSGNATSEAVALRVLPAVIESVSYVGWVFVVEC